ncbi:MAG: Hint domain-containing protein [Roseicyclus sp.]|uniref:Hint domain-containing protein n=1 Tax=Roseicyclus sp. TaxID=1914329 RepID=UPI003BAE9027
MATYAYVDVARFTNIDGTFVNGALLGESGTLNDGEDDNTFEGVENVDGGVRPGQVYEGFVEIGGQQWPAFSGPPGELFVYFATPVTPPLNFTMINPFPFTVCFAPGTAIATPEGAVAVEALSIGDPVLTADGRTVPVKWVGRQTRAPLFQRIRMIRVAAGALADRLPLRDLVLTADHALLIDGLLINAGALVNGTTITELRDLPERVTVYHIETEAHDVILAEGTPAETFIDYAGRQAFDNYAEYVALYDADRPIAENPAPRISSARMLPAALCARLGIRRAA